MSGPHPILFLVSAPSGTGKTTLCRRLLESEPELRYSVSVTTRPPREGEVNGVDYEFADAEDFRRRVEAGEFLEHAEVHGNLYGTSKLRIHELFEQNFSVLMDVDVQGARLIREALRGDSGMGRVFHDVFITPPSLEVLRDRLEGRGQDRREVIERRLRNARREMEEAPRYEFQVVNDCLESAYADLHSVFRACRLRTLRE